MNYCKLEDLMKRISSLPHTQQELLIQIIDCCMRAWCSPSEVRGPENETCDSASETRDPASEAQGPASEARDPADEARDPASETRDPASEAQGPSGDKDRNVEDR